MVDIHQERILILDFGSQYTQLIARRVREIGVYCEVFPYDIPDSAINDFAPKGIILSGGHESVTTDFTPRIPNIVFELGCPVLGICYGMQAMAAQLGGSVIAATHREFGHASLCLHGHTALFEAIEDHTSATGASLLDVWMSHGDKVTGLPPGFVIAASTKNAAIAAMADESRQFYGVQFHPEVSHTSQGIRMLRHFVLKICGCEQLWTIANLSQELVTQCRDKIGDDAVILGLSGGVDSSVVAALLQKAVGTQLTCVFVDHGLLRLHEAEQIMAVFTKHFGIDVRIVDASQRFFVALAGVTDPEEKRKIIGREFIAVFDEEASKLQNAKWLAQGTIYPDVIESAGTHTGKAKVIKSHHNVGGLPEDMNLKLVEPLRELFKDEVRQLGLELGLPSELVMRHPFPGPGLAVRILGEVKREYAEILRLADAIFIEELYRADLYHKVSQAFVVLLPVNSVAVKGDGRYHEPVVALRAVETSDFMTATAAHLPYEFLTRVTQRIVNEVPGISRVVYDITSKPPATIEWE